MAQVICFNTMQTSGVLAITQEVERTYPSRQASIYYMSQGKYVLDTEKRVGEKVIFRSRDLEAFFRRSLFRELRAHFNIRRPSGFPLITEDDIQFPDDNHFDIVKYGTGGFFSKHTDMKLECPDGCVQYTVIIGLENTKKGGETVIHTAEKSQTYVTGAIGRVLMFDASLQHEGLTVLEGTKKILTATVFINMKAAPVEYPDEYYDDDDFCNGWEY